MKNKDLKRRILDISYKNKLSHLGSCLTAIDIIEEIYQTKKPDEKFVLSAGHAGLALYVVIEKHFGIDAEGIWNQHGTHPDRCEKCHLDCSSGSLGNGLPIAVGIALADRSKNVYCLISDGECSEGSIWEALRIAEEQKLDNLKLYFNFNGWGAYKSIESSKLIDNIMTYDFLSNIFLTNIDQFPFLKGQSAHYVIMSKEQYEEALRILSD